MWSPEQITGTIKSETSENISHKAIYQFIYHQIHRNGWGLLKPGHEDLRIYLRRRKKRRVHKGIKKCQRIFRSKKTSISKRLAIVEQKKRLGNWESDSVESINYKPRINTLVDRKTELVFITKPRGRTSEATISVIKASVKYLPKKANKLQPLIMIQKIRNGSGLKKEPDLRLFLPMLIIFGFWVLYYSYTQLNSQES